MKVWRLKQLLELCSDSDTIAIEVMVYSAKEECRVPESFAIETVDGPRSRNAVWVIRGHED